MIQKIWETIKTFFTNGSFATWLDTYIVYFVIVGAVIIIVLTTLIIIKLNKDIKILNKEKRKRDKQLLRFISNKKNKTF